LAALHERAELLASRGLPPHEICHNVLRLAELYRRLGAALPPDIALQVVRELSGLAGWNPLDTWQERVRQLPPSAVESIEMPDEVECERRHRAFALCDWLRASASTELAERIVNFAEEAALKEISDAG
jgi:hypothetical protein